ncbi:MAG: anti-sigma factor family protein [Phycisphaerae bacterium]
MTCREVAQFLMDYLDGELPGDSVAVFERHLTACRECRDYLDSYQRTIGASRAVFAESEAPCEEPLPADLVKAILASRVTAKPTADSGE